MTRGLRASDLPGALRRTIIARMRPSVAVTATQLGLTLKRVETAWSVDRAIDRIFAGTQSGTLR